MNGLLVLNGFIFNINEITCCRDFDGGMTIEYKNGRDPVFLACSVAEFNDAFSDAVIAYQELYNDKINSDQGAPVGPAVYHLTLPEKGE